MHANAYPKNSDLFVSDASSGLDEFYTQARKTAARIIILKHKFSSAVVNEAEKWSRIPKNIGEKDGRFHAVVYPSFSRGLKPVWKAAVFQSHGPAVPDILIEDVLKPLALHHFRVQPFCMPVFKMLLVPGRSADYYHTHKEDVSLTTVFDELANTDKPCGTEMKMLNGERFYTRLGDFSHMRPGVRHRSRPFYGGTGYRVHAVAMGGLFSRLINWAVQDVPDMLKRTLG